MHLFRCWSRHLLLLFEKWYEKKWVSRRKFETCMVQVSLPSLAHAAHGGGAACFERKHTVPGIRSDGCGHSSQVSLH